MKDKRRNKSKAIGERSRNFEQRSSNEDDVRAGTLFSQFPHHVNVRTLSHDRLNVHQPLYTLGRFSVNLKVGINCINRASSTF
ncbi:hypothetical protein TNCV_1898871 [Trichonephila clavipes]|nr:hypothetical protein TNCV_1898871 [Trichonephila clavipes]